MSTTEGDAESFQHSESEHPFPTRGPDGLFGEYSVVSPGVQIVIDGRAVSAPATD